MGAFGQGERSVVEAADVSWLGRIIAITHA
jgi:hypothetical protein